MSASKMLITALLALSPLLGLSAANRLSSEEEIMQEKLQALEGLRAAGEASELEVTLFKARMEARKDRPIEPTLTEQEQGIVRRLRLLAASDRGAALSNLLLEIDESTGAALNFIAGTFYAEREDWSSAKEQFEFAVEKFPDYFEARKSLGIVCIRLEQWEGAKQALLGASALKSDLDPSVSGLLGLCYSKLGEMGTAEIYLERALQKLEGEEAEQWRNELATVLLQQGKHEEAVPVLEALYAKELARKAGGLVDQSGQVGVELVPVPLDLNIEYDGGEEAVLPGEVQVEFMVTDQGEAIDAHILESSDPRLIAPTLEGLRTSRWQPAQHEGKSVSVRVRKRFTFD